MTRPTPVADSLVRDPGESEAAALDEKAMDAAIKAALRAEIIPIPEYPGHGVKIEDYLNYDAGAAVELGIRLTEKDKDGKPRFHWYSDIRGEEYEETNTAILAPVLGSAIRAYLAALAPAAMAVPDMVLVPREATEAVIDAFASVKPSCNIQDADRVWDAMLAAALTTQVSSGGEAK